jgi:aspartate aminotransferase-like enzyme
MEYTSLFNPLLIIFISLLAGMLVGGIGMMIVSSRELKATQEELDKFRDLYFAEVEKWKGKYDADEENRFTTRTGALAR